MEPLVALTIFVVGFCIYFLPSFVAKRKVQANGVFLINLFFGWSMIGWIIALIWAFTGGEKQKEVICPQCSGVFPIVRGQKLFVCPNCSERTSLEVTNG